ncbi:MAG: tyrosine-type recombinase/integrase [Thermodesulfobacteriota bacterium]
MNREEADLAARARAVVPGLPASFLKLEISGLSEMLDCESVTPRNRELILQFLNHISPEVTERRVTFYTHKLRKMAVWLEKDFDAATEEDLRSLVTFLTRGNARRDGKRYSVGTLHGYKVALKRFYRWLEGQDEEYPRKVRWIKSSGDSTRIVEPKELLSFEEILEMIRHARNTRDKALVSFLYESGARASEMLSMKIRHVEFTSTMVKATLPVSKTQPRVIPLVACKSHLATWLNYHPQKHNPEAPLWSNLKGDGRNALLNQTVGHILKRLASDAGIRKRVYPHLFRACSITHKQTAGWPEQAVKAFHGLCKDSKVMKHYSHLSYSNLEDIQKRMNGLPSEERNDINLGVKCPRCGQRNPLYAEACACGLPTEMKSVPGNPDLESQIRKRVEETMTDFVQSRQPYDRMMDHFMNALLAKANNSPELMKAIHEIGTELRESRCNGTPVQT